MGGYGSGRRSTKQKAEHCRSLDVNRMHREGCLQLGQCGNWVWTQDGDEVARIGYQSTEDGLALRYKVRVGGKDWESISQTIPLTRKGCNYGGSRPYFVCNGVVNGRHCRRRVGKVFAGGKYFLCRHCYRIAYSSQSEATYDRMLRRANKTRMALGGHAGTAHFIAPKPKGMWQRTYQQKRDEIWWCEHQADKLFIDKFSHLLRQSDLDGLMER